MGNPVNDKTITSHHGHTGAPDRDRLSERLALGNLMSYIYGETSEDISVKWREDDESGIEKEHSVPQILSLDITENDFITRDEPGAGLHQRRGV